MAEKRNRLLKVSYSKDFSRDLAILAKKSPEVLISAKYITAIYCLLNRLPLPATYQDHALGGNWKYYRDCHIQGDLVLIYKYEIFDDYDEIRFARLNSHSALAL